MNKKILAGILTGLIIIGITVLIIYWPVWFPEEKPDKTPTKHLILEIDSDDRDVYDSNDEVNIAFKKDGRFVLKDKFGKFEGDYDYIKKKDGKGELTISFDTRSPKNWYIKFKDKNNFKGVRDNEDNEGTYKWKDSLETATEHLSLTIEFDEYDEYETWYRYKEGDVIDVIFQGNDRFVYYDKFGDWTGDYDYYKYEYKENRYLDLEYDDPENETFYGLPFVYYPCYVNFLNKTHFVALEKHHFGGTYEWI